MNKMNKGFWIGVAMLVMGLVGNVFLQVKLGYDKYTSSILGIPISSLTETYNLGIVLLIWVAVGLFLLVHYAKKYGATAMFIAIVLLLSIPCISVNLLV